MRSRGKKGNEAELLFKKWLEWRGYTVHRAARAGFVQRGDMKFCQSHDLFGVFDMLAIAPGATWAVQVTTQNGRTVRRRKIEALKDALPRDWLVTLVTHEATENPAHRGRRLNFWRLEHFSKVSITGGTGNERDWDKPDAVAFDPKVVEDHARLRAGRAPQSAQEPRPGSPRGQRA